MLGVLAKRYAKAFFAEAESVGKERVVLRELAELGKVFAAPEMVLMLKDKFSFVEKKAVFEALSNELKVDELTLKMAVFLLQKGRIDCLGGVLSKMQQMLDDKDRTERVKIGSKKILSQDELSNLKTILEQMMGKKVIFETVIDGSLMAGVQVFIRDVCYDASLKTQLAELKKQLISVE